VIEYVKYPVGDAMFIDNETWPTVRRLLIVGLGIILGMAIFLIATHRIQPDRFYSLCLIVASCVLLWLGSDEIESRAK
jgi:hypothetical protein